MQWFNAVFNQYVLEKVSLYRIGRRIQKTRPRATKITSRECFGWFLVIFPFAKWLIQPKS